MSADLLREAAALMRTRAEAATPGPWEVGDWWHIQGASHCRCESGPLVWKGVRDINGADMLAHVHRMGRPIGADIMQADASDGCPASVTVGNDWGSAADRQDANHIASWHPTVALAVADWLDFEAEREPTPGCADPTCRGSRCGFISEANPQALAVARAYLGSDQ